MKSTYPWPSMASASATELNFIIKFFKAKTCCVTKENLNSIQFNSYHIYMIFLTNHFIFLRRTRK